MEKNVYLSKFFKKIKNILNIYIILLIIIDIISKIIIINTIKLHKYYYINYYVNFVYIQNYGINLGLLKKNQIIIYFLIIISIGFLIYIRFSLKDQNIQLSYNLIISGILGNLINRIYYSFVIDFIDIHILNYQLPICNFADIFIFIGFIYILKKYIIF